MAPQQRRETWRPELPKRVYCVGCGLSWWRPGGYCIVDCIRTGQRRSWRRPPCRRGCKLREGVVIFSHPSVAGNVRPATLRIEQDVIDRLTKFAFVSHDAVICFLLPNGTAALALLERTCCE